MTKIAHIGCGYWGKNLVRDFAQLGALAAIVEPNPEQAAKLSAEHSVPVRSLDEVLADPAIDALSFATPAVTHASLAIQAMRAGKHVFMEKPLALSVEEGEEVLDVAEETGKLVMVGHLLQYHPIFAKLRDLVQAGEIGRIQHVYSNRMSLGKYRLEENVWWSFAPHDISMVLALVGEEPINVTAQGNAQVTPGIADWCTAQCRFPSGARAHFNISWHHPFKEQRLVVIGDKGMAVFEDSHPDWDKKLAIYRHGLTRAAGLAPVPVKADPDYVAVAPGNPLKTECQHFIDSIAAGQQPRTNAQEGLAVLRVLQAGEAALQASLKEDV
jgi:UDP-2-acetamido-3-amino-2,3-dideoxy-glucuronate N-acetyltransferase